MLQLFNPGDTIYGYCNGYFGRDDYDDKVCVMVTPKYAVFQNAEGEGSVLRYSNELFNTINNNDRSNNWNNEANEL